VYRAPNEAICFLLSLPFCNNNKNPIFHLASTFPTWESFEFLHGVRCVSRRFEKTCCLQHQYRIPVDLCTNVNLPDEDTEMSKHVAVYIIQRDTVVIYNRALVGCNKTEVNTVPKTERLKNYINTSGTHKSLWNALLASNHQKLVYLHCIAWQPSANVL